MLINMISKSTKFNIILHTVSPHDMYQKSVCAIIRYNADQYDQQTHVVLL